MYSPFYLCVGAFTRSVCARGAVSCRVLRGWVDRRFVCRAGSRSYIDSVIVVHTDTHTHTADTHGRAQSLSQTSGQPGSDPPPSHRSWTDMEGSWRRGCGAPVPSDRVVAHAIASRPSRGGVAASSGSRVSLGRVSSLDVRDVRSVLGLCRARSRGGACAADSDERKGRRVVRSRSDLNAFQL